METNISKQPTIFGLGCQHHGCQKISMDTGPDDVRQEIDEKADSSLTDEGRTQNSIDVLLIG